MGRPSLAAERREDILRAYEDLLPERGLGVSFKQIASRAGMSPSIITHYFGSREELDEALVARNVERHRAAFLASVEKFRATQERVDALLDFMFGGPWTDLSRRDYIVPELFAEARRNASARALIGDAFKVFEATIREILQQTFPSASEQQATDVAYAILCIGLSHHDFRAAGFERGRNESARRAAATLAQSLRRHSSADGRTPAAKARTKSPAKRR